MTLFEFKTEEAVRRWHTENDVVMGGVSSSLIGYRVDAEHGGVLRFTGNVSLENGGGFAQILYDKSSFDLSGFAGIELLLKGDNHAYELRLEKSSEQPAYAQAFPAKNAWERVRLPFADFEATFHGEAVPDAAALDLAAINTVGVLIGGGHEGSFELLLAEIKAYQP